MLFFEFILKLMLDCFMLGWVMVICVLVWVWFFFGNMFRWLVWKVVGIMFGLVGLLLVILLCSFILLFLVLS